MTAAAIPHEPPPASTGESRSDLRGTPRVSPWIQMASGRPWDVLAPGPAQVHWPDIADSLAKLCRFNGHTMQFYSVAQHCVHVAELLPPDWRLYGLLHDAHEAVLGDIATPVKIALHAATGSDAVADLADRTDRAIHAAAGLSFPLPAPVALAVREADLRLLQTERRDLMATSRRPWPRGPQPAPFRIKPWPWARAAEEWLERLGRYQTSGKPLPRFTEE